MRCYSCPYSINWEPERMRATAVRLSRYTGIEYQRTVEICTQLDMEGPVAEESFIPEFDGRGI